jgi:pilus assembly protein Flp/PilA
LKTIPRCFIREESGSAVIEYGLISALISVVIVAAVSLIGTTLSGIFAAIGTAFGAG